MQMCRYDMVDALILKCNRRKQMPNINTRADKEKKPGGAELNASPGDNPVEITPKDISPSDAAARDMRVRPIASPDPEERGEALLDDAIEDTFPASDPIALPTYEETMKRRNAASARKQPDSKG
jgi:hypothetical protein